MGGERRLRTQAGSEHVFGECMSPVITDAEIPPYRELTDSEQAAEEATWD